VNTIGEFFQSKIGNASQNPTISLEYNLDQNYPNPFNPSTTISYSIAQDGLVSLKVFDVLGDEVATLIDELKTAGNYSVEFNAQDLPSGVYFYQLQVDRFVETKKLILLR